MPKKTPKTKIEHQKSVNIETQVLTETAIAEVSELPGYKLMDKEKQEAILSFVDEYSEYRSGQLQRFGRTHNSLRSIKGLSSSEQSDWIPELKDIVDECYNDLLEEALAR